MSDSFPSHFARSTLNIVAHIRAGSRDVNERSSASRPTRAFDCNRSAIAGLDATAHLLTPKPVKDNAGEQADDRADDARNADQRCGPSAKSQSRRRAQPTPDQEPGRKQSRLTVDPANDVSEYSNRRCYEPDKREREKAADQTREHLLWMKPSVVEHTKSEDAATPNAGATAAVVSN